LIGWARPVCHDCSIKQQPFREEDDVTNERMGGNQTDQPAKPGEAGYQADQEEQDTQDRGAGGQQGQKQNQDEGQRQAR
jgi:hypothetical protein